MTTEQLAELLEKHPRVIDLLRYCRHQLLDEKLITQDEFTALLRVDGAAARLETYDELLEEVERLKSVVDAAVEWRRFGYEREHDFYVGISPLLDAIDTYDVGQRRPSTEYTGD